MSLSYLNLINEINNVENIINNYELLEEIKAKAKGNVLHIMLYGTYNAGKSSLINALLSKEEASVADIPTTDKVDYYCWNNMFLLDTPGVNAPIQHEHVTEEQLKKSSVILFVIRDGDMDSKDVYDRLFNLLERDKKIFIVLNNQLQNKDDKEKAISHIRKILVNRAEKKNLELKKFSSIDIIPVNIKTALTARLKNHSKLLEYSGFSDFIELFEQWVTQQDEENEKFESFKKVVNESLYLPKLNEIANSFSSQDKNKIEQLERNKENLYLSKNILMSSISFEIRKNISDNRSYIFDILNSERSEVEIQSELEAIFRRMSLSIENKINEELNNFSFEFNNRYYLNKTDNTSKNILFEKVSEGTRKLVTDKDFLKNTLLLGRKFNLPLLKGRWEKTLGNWSAKGAVVLQTLFAVYDAYSSAKSEQEYNEKQRQYLLELHQTVEKICNDFLDIALKSTRIAIDEFFNTQIELIQNEINELEHYNTEIQNQYNSLSQSQMRMLAIPWNV